MAAFGDLLSELRRDKKMTQNDLAKVLFVPPALSPIMKTIYISPMFPN